MPRDNVEQNRIQRRDFGRQLAAIAGTTASTLVVVSSSAVVAVAETPKAPVRPEEPAEKNAEPPEPPPELMLLTYLVGHYRTEKFDKQAIQGIYRDIQGDVARGKVLADFPLQNSDEPAFSFAAYCGPQLPSPKN